MGREQACAVPAYDSLENAGTALRWFRPDMVGPVKGQSWISQGQFNSWVFHPRREEESGTGGMATVDQSDIRGLVTYMTLIRRGAAFVYERASSKLGLKAGPRVPRTVFPSRTLLLLR